MISRRILPTVVACLFALAGLGSGPCTASAQNHTRNGPTPPRLRFIDGEVSFWRPGAEDWSAAQVNTALAAGDSLYAGDGANLELQIGARAFVRAGAGTEIDLTSLDPDYLQFRITGRPCRPRPEERCPRPNDRGRYAECRVHHRSSRLLSRRRRREHDGIQRPPRRGSDGRAGRRGGDRRRREPADRPRGYRHGSGQRDRGARARCVGSLELRSHGAARRGATQRAVRAAGDCGRRRSRSLRRLATSSRATATSGFRATCAPIGRPTARAGGCTIRTMSGPGSTTSPWGWAPYHYGRWVHFDGDWGWAPGPVVAAPVYSPALVAFFGAPGIGVSVGVGLPFVSWCALGFGEPVVPWWGRPGFVGRPYWGGWGGPRVVNNVVINNTRIVNVTNITNYQNVQRQERGDGSGPQPVRPRPHRARPARCAARATAAAGAR